MKPASTPAAVAAVVTDRTSLALLDQTPRQFRAFLVREGIPHAKIGRRTVARLDRILEAIDRLSGAAPRPTSTWNEDEVIELAVVRR